MQIGKELDRVFRITVTEKEAEFLCDASRMNFERSKQIVTRIGSNLLAFMQNALVYPHTGVHSIELEL